MRIHPFDRRRFLQASAAIGLFGSVPAIRAAEPPPETRRLRLGRVDVADVACLGPIWIAGELLRAEGFEDVQYVPLFNKELPDEVTALDSGAIDITQTDVFATLLALDAGKAMVGLGGIHAGCYVLYGAPGLRAIRDLRGKTIAVANTGRRGFVSAMLAHVGLDPRKDAKFVETFEGVRLLAEGKVDATLGFPPEPQLMRAKKIGVQIVNTAVDRPWSQYFCCMAVGNRGFVAKHPVATKRALRAILKAADICAAEPERVARTLVDRGFLKDYEYSLLTLKDIPYKRCASTTRPTACASMRSGCTKAGSSSRARRSWSRRAPTGGLSSS